MSIETLTIAGMGHRGEGVAHSGADTVFVPATLPGETVVVDREGQRGRLEAIVVASPERVAPFCPHFGACGGCQVQHWAPEHYAAWKRGLAVEALARAGLDAEILPLVPAHGHGRRRATLHATADGAGYMALRSHTIHPIETCPILVPELAAAPQLARAIAQFLGPCDVSVTATLTGLDVHARAPGAGKTKLRVRPEVTRALAQVAETYGLARLSVDGEPLITLRPPRVVMGRAQPVLPVGSFLQATEAAETILAGLVLEQTRGAKSIADLFCGLGPFALRLAEKAQVYAADSDGWAIASLAATIRETPKLKAITAERRDLFREPLPRFELNRFDTVVIDPPRAGAKAQIAALAESGVRRIVSVSCDPQSFARDARVLVGAGYALGPVTPVDQFAWSAHLELVASFTRR